MRSLPHLVVVGASHRTAPVAVRERLAIPSSQLAGALDDVRRGTGVSETAILSTCNRIEVYAVTESPEAHLASIRDWFVARSRGAAGLILPHVYQMTDRQTAAHLFRVTAGLDSMVLGESEIAAQVKQAYQAAWAAGTTGPVINRLFQKALHSAKLVRRRTGLAHGSASIGSVVVDLAHELFGERLAGRRALLWGAGKAAETTARHLLKAGLTQLSIVNRTPAKAEELAAACQGQWVAWEQARAHLAHVDIAVVGTQAPHYILDRADIQAALPQRAGRPLVLVDLAVPRNVDPDVSCLPGIRLYNVDDLQAIAQCAMDRRSAASASAETLIDQQLACWQGRDVIQKEDVCELVEA